MHVTVYGLGARYTLLTSSKLVSWPLSLEYTRLLDAELMLSVQLAANEGFEPFSLFPSQELSVETIMRVTVSTLPPLRKLWC